MSKNIPCPVCGSPVTLEKCEEYYKSVNPITGSEFEFPLSVVNEYLSAIRTITVQEAADRTGKSKQYISKLAHDGKIRAVMANGRIIAVLEADILEMMNND